MTPSSRRFFISSRALALLALWAGLSPREGCAETRLKVGMAVPSYAHAVLWIAKDGGFFARHGLAAEVFVLRGSADAARLVLSGDMDVVLAGGDAVVKADLAGGDLVAFAGLVNTFYHRLAAGPSVRRPAELKGRSIGLPFLGGPQDMTVKAALKRFGLGYDTDVRILSLGAEYARLAAVAQGRVDAVTTDAPPSVLKGLGLHVVADVPSWKIPFPYMAAVARRSFLQEKEEAASAFLKALFEASVFYRDHPAESLAILSRAMPSEKGGQAAAWEGYRFNGPSRLAYPPSLDPAGFKTVLESVEDPAARSRRPAEFMDTRLLDRLKREGFFRRRAKGV